MTFEELVFNPEVPEWYIEGEPDAYKTGYQEGAKTGAQWQKEQDKELKDAAERALNYLSVKYPKEAEILHELKQAIEKYNH